MLYQQVDGMRQLNFLNWLDKVGENIRFLSLEIVLLIGK